MDRIKVAICDDIEHICDYFEFIFDKESSIEYVGAANDSPSCIKLVEEKNPDVLLLDIQMEQNDAGLELIPKLKEVNPNLKIILFTIHEEYEYILRAFTYGVDDYLIKTTPVEQILSSISDVYNNKLLLRPSIAKVLLAEVKNVKTRQNSLLYVMNLMTKLSNSEFEILKELCKGFTYKQIAENRFIDGSTVRSHVNGIVKKFGAVDIKKLVEEITELDVFSLFK